MTEPDWISLDAHNETIDNLEDEIDRLKAALRVAILDTKRVTNICIEAGTATYCLKWSDRTREWATLCNLHIDQYNPWNSKPKWETPT